VPQKNGKSFLLRSVAVGAQYLSFSRCTSPVNLGSFKSELSAPVNSSCQRNPSSVTIMRLSVCFFCAAVKKWAEIKRTVKSISFFIKWNLWNVVLLLLMRFQFESPCSFSQSPNLSIHLSEGKLFLFIPKPWPPLE